MTNDWGPLKLTAKPVRQDWLIRTRTPLPWLLKLNSWWLVRTTCRTFFLAVGGGGVLTVEVTKRRLSAVRARALSPRNEGDLFAMPGGIAVLISAQFATQSTACSVTADLPSGRLSFAASSVCTSAGTQTHESGSELSPQLSCTAKWRACFAARFTSSGNL